MSTINSKLVSPRRWKCGLAAIGLLAIGGVAGGAIAHEFRPPIEMAPTHLVAIRNLAASAGIVTIKGRVAESFGSRMVIDDGTGRALIEGGPRGEGNGLAPIGATVSVQGRFDRDSFHPSFLTDPSGTVTPIGPPFGRHGAPGFDGPEPDGPGRAPPPALQPRAAGTPG
jgi:hypothetical protein